MMIFGKNFITRRRKSICQFLGGSSHFACNVYLPIAFPVFPPTDQYTYTIPIQKSSYHLKLFSCRIGYCFLGTTVYSYDDILTP